MPTTPPVLLIAGCGYLGQEIARTCRACGWHAIGLTRNPASAHEAASTTGIQVLAADLGDVESLLAIKAGLPGIDAIVHAASSSRGGPDAYRRVFIDGLSNLQHVFHPARLLFTSSTSVYAQTDGSEVTESSPATGGSETSRLLLEAEQVALQHAGTVVRLAGLYGPGRCVVLRKFFDGSAVLEDGGQRVLNQIHRDDAAAAVLHLLGLPEGSGGIHNAADDTPMSQRDIHEALAIRFKLPLPPVGPKPVGRKRGWTSKRVSNAKLRATGWAPAYPSFLDAVDMAPNLVDSILRS